MTNSNQFSLGQTPIHPSDKNEKSFLFFYNIFTQSKTEKQETWTPTPPKQFVHLFLVYFPYSDVWFKCVIVVKKRAHLPQVLALLQQGYCVVFTPEEKN